MAIRYPAILVGGPADASISWLTYALHQALRERRIAHYVLRVQPGDNSHQPDQPSWADADQLHRYARQGWNAPFVAQIRSAIAARHLPLLVEAGSSTLDETLPILSECNGAILISAEADQFNDWRSEIAAQGLPLLAELRLAPYGPQRITSQGATLRGTVSGLSAEQGWEGLCFAALLERMDILFRFAPQALRRMHAALINIEPLDLEAARSIHNQMGAAWKPTELPGLLASLARCAPLAVYGDGPAWLYAALAAWNHPARLMLFDVALGWVSPPDVTLCDKPDTRLKWTRRLADGSIHLAFACPGGWLDYDTAAGIAVPRIDPAAGVVLDGQLPLWLYAALARAYTIAAWVGVYERLANVVVVTHSRCNDIEVGSIRAPAFE